MKNIRILLLLVFHLYVTHGNDSRVQIEDGILVGKKILTESGRSVHAFYGIPYAEPPRGNLRFRDPVAKKGWNGVLNAQKAGNACIQLRDEKKIIGDEDCLVLNVYTPTLHSMWKSLLPVMVFIHGGVYKTGEGGPKAFSPRFLLDRTNIILVTINYRLGVFGFLSTGDRIAPGNFGLKDQRLALQWVNRNIHEFGGDSSRITLFGHSVGSGSVGLHALSESSQQYFQQYIMQSGAPLAPWSYTTNPRYFDYSLLIASKLNCPTSNTSAAVECLRHQPFAELFEASRIVGVETGIGFWPSIEHKYDNAFLTDTPANLLKQGKVKDAPVITGTATDEGLILAIEYYTNDTKYQSLRMDPDKEIRYLLNFFQLVQRTNLTELATQCKLFYFGKTLPPDRNTLITRFSELISDYTFNYPFTLTRDVLQSAKHPVYVYQYNFIGRLSETQLVSRNDDVNGTCHGDDLYYLLDWKKVFNPKLRINRTKSEERITHLLVDFWTSFAINGKPESNLLPDPEIWTDASCMDTYLEIGDERKPVVTLRDHFMERRMGFWQNVAPEFPL